MSTPSYVDILFRGRKAPRGARK